MTHKQPQVEPDGRYTVIKAARLLGVGRQTIYDWISNDTFRDGELGVSKYGHRPTFILGRAILRVWSAAWK